MRYIAHDKKGGKKNEKKKQHVKKKKKKKQQTNKLNKLYSLFEGKVLKEQGGETSLGAALGREFLVERGQFLHFVVAHVEDHHLLCREKRIRRGRE